MTCEMAHPLQIGIIAYDGVQALDIVGPADAFAAAIISENGRERVRGYKVALIGLGSRPIRSESGIVFQPGLTVRDSPEIDTLIVPGGVALRLNPQTQHKVAQFLREQSKRIRRIAAVCTGVYGIAPSGVLDGRRVTTHWRFASDLATRFPKLKVDANALYLKDGSFYSSAGITAGIDLSLALIEEDYGPRIALDVAREMVVYLKRSGGQEQYSEPLQFQSRAQDRLANVAVWIVNHLGEDLSVERLAEKVNVSTRHFNRLFKNSFGNTPADFVEKLRLGEARRLLGERGSRIEAAGLAVGFASGDSFRRAFERRFGLTPAAYRGRFQVKAPLRAKSSSFRSARRRHA